MIVIDTHVLIWLASGNTKAISKKAMLTIRKAVEQGWIGVPAICAWEVSMLVAHGRLGLTMPVADWFNQLLQVPTYRIINIDHAIAIESTALPGDFHKDPADRMIVATARLLNLPLLSADEKIQRYKHVKCIW